MTAPTTETPALAGDGETTHGGTPTLGERLTGHGWWTVIWFAIGATLGASPLGDNSFLTHLATGRLMLEHGAVHVDPYSWTRAGSDWVVQSWGASGIYATLEEVGGAAAIRVVVALVAGTLLALVWRLTRPAGGLLGRLLLMALAGGSQFAGWSERPQIFAFALLAAALVIVMEGRPAWWLAPMFAVWVNLHGSFPVGIAAVGLVTLALVMERRESWRRLVTVGTAAVAGSIVGAACSPYGGDLLTFPVKLLGRSEVLQYIREWQQPTLDDPTTWFAIALGLLATWSIVRRRAWAWAPVVIVFGAMGAMSTRNLVLAAIVSIPAIAPGLADLGTIPSPKPVGPRRLAIGLTVVMALVVGAILATDDFDLGTYPVAAVDWLDGRGLVANPDVHVITYDYVGNYLEYREGDRANVFLDDRAELFGLDVVRDYMRLLNPTVDNPQLDESGSWADVLDRHAADVVVWKRNGKLVTEALSSSPDWVVGYSDAKWVVMCRAASELGC